jgi:diguanylate cyclase (GGDEF)-like protein
MKYFGRIFTVFITIVMIVGWHASYFLIDKNESYRFLITNGFMKYDFIYTPLLLPFFWWLGKKYDEAKFYSEKDALTEVYNRRFVLKIFPNLLEQADRNKEKLSVFVVDIDNFKKINDTYGHDVGDAVIRGISDSLLKNTRKSDLVTRWGGDEFLVIMPHSDEMCPSLLLQHMDKDLKDSSNRLGINISVSIGKSTYPENAIRLDDLIRFADKSMYELKSAKNR